MRKRDEQRAVRTVKFLQKRSDDIEADHDAIDRGIHNVKKSLENLGGIDKSAPELMKRKQTHLRAMSQQTILPSVRSAAIYDEAELEWPDKVGINDILTPNDLAVVDKRVAAHIEVFNVRYSLDEWDYAIAGACGLFAAMLDLLLVKAPAKPTTQWTKKVDGVFNRAAQEAFNRVLPPEVSEEIGRLNSIGGADASTVAQLLGALPGTLNPKNHRLRSLAHDPILGFLFGFLDMRDGKCTVVVNGRIKRYPTTAKPVDDGLFPSLGRMFGHLLSDVNAPSARGNRGHGLPAPFMGLLRMFEDIKIGDSDLGKQIEFMYVNGYDFRQFVVTSIPMLIMEVVMRVFYAVKQVKLAGAPLGEALMDTMPRMMNPRFRMMLAMGYGTAAAVNVGKVYITRDILNLSYATWLGLAWNCFHALKWGLLQKHLKLWEEIERKEIDELEHVVDRIEGLVERAQGLPV